MLVDLALLLAVGTSAVTDLLRGKIYNVVTYPAVALGVLCNCLLPGGVGLQACLIGLAVGFIPFFVLFALGLMAKSMLVTFPFVLLLLDYWPLGRFRFGDSEISAQCESSVVGWRKLPAWRLIVE